MQSTCRKYKRSIATNTTAIIIAALVCGFCFRLSAQLIVPQTAAIAVSEPAFNPEFVSLNHIKTITASVVDKPDGEIIRDKGLAQVYVFDSTGNLTRHYFNEITTLVKTETEIPTVYNKRGRVVKQSTTKIDFQYQYDTLGTEYAYTSTGYVIMKRVCMGNVYNTTYYEYFGNGLVSKQIVCKETNTAQHEEPFKLGVQTILSEEKFEYENLTPTQVKKQFLNDEGKAYKQGIINFANGKITGESYQFLTGFIRSSVSYKYDDTGRLSEKTTTDNSSGYNTEIINYEYAPDGNLMAEKRFKNGTQTAEVVYMYDEQKKFLSTQLTRNIEKSSIKIVKFEYVFY